MNSEIIELKRLLKVLDHEMASKSAQSDIRFRAAIAMSMSEINDILKEKEKEQIKIPERE